MKPDITRTWSRADAAPPLRPADEPQTMFDLLRDRADEQPDHPAIEDGSLLLTYRELLVRAECLASELAERDVAAGDAVVLYQGRSVDFVVAVFALWRLGAIVVPVDRATPEERLNELLDDCAATLAIVSHESDVPGSRIPAVAVETDGAPAGRAAPSLQLEADAPTRAAYCLYTSGSTGRPKGVLVSQSSIIHYSRASAARLELTPRDRCLQICSLGFDGAMHEICTAIAAGACLVIYPQSNDVTTVGLDEFINRLGVSAALLPTALWRVWVTEHAWAGEPLPSCLRLIMTGGEKLERSDLDAWRSLNASGSPILVNAYGPTEATIASTMWSYKGGDLFAAGDDVPIGSPLEGYRCHVVDDRLRPVPAGEIGQLAIAGAGVGMGYLGRPEETAAAFVQDPFSANSEERMYLTGDRVRLNAAGLFEFVGRADGQVKILGHRVEVGEVECALRNHPDVADAAVVVCDSGQDKHLVAFCQPRPGRALSGSRLREWLASSKPYYLVPRRIQILDVFPTTISGKIDRRALSARASLVEAAAPDTPSQMLDEKLAAIWKLTLGVENVAGGDNFFDCGGHSLLVAKLIWAIRQVTGAQLSYRDVFTDPTYDGIATAVRDHASRQNAAAPPPAGEMDAEVDGWGPVTFQQRRLLNQADQDFATAIRVVPVMFEFSGPLDVDRLQRALERTINRHAVFHTRFRQLPGGEWQQRVTDGKAIEVERTAIRADPGDDRDLREVARAAASAWAFRGMDIRAGELVRARILASGRDRTWLVIAFHHIAMDAQSLSPLMVELFGAYSRDVSEGPAETLYLHYAKEQEARVESGAYAQDLDFWAQYLEGVEPVMLPRASGSHPGAPALPRSLAEFIDGDSLLRLRACAAAEGTTVFTLCLVALILVLAEITGRDDVLVGIPHHNRPGPKYRDCVGYFVNSIPVRIRTGGFDSIRSLLTEVQSHLQTAPQHLGVSMADVPLPLREGCSRVFQVMMVDEHVRPYGTIRGLTIEPIRLAAPFIKSDLDVGLSDRGEQLRFSFGFDAAFLSDHDVSVWLKRFVELIERLAGSAGRLDKLTLSGAEQGLHP
ncbi:MAG TPA: amino acid adenylation domain-containing protein [Allosphingosinicella sp.]|nr:amino acid adenylation domain-containing protein [Allosphingosinicella sp.]